jgi:type II secretory pathway pseudopilin PulG
MIVVALVAILASVAVVAYSRHMKSARIVGARTFIASIQAQQAAYMQQFGQYCDVSGNNVFYPALVRNSDRMEPSAKQWVSIPQGWGDLGVMPSGGHSYFAFNVRASSPADDHVLEGQATNALLKIPAQPAVGDGSPHPWYYIIAHGDLSDPTTTTYTDGSCGSPYLPNEQCTTLATSSARSDIAIFNEGG